MRAIFTMSVNWVSTLFMSVTRGAYSNRSKQSGMHRFLPDFHKGDLSTPSNGLLNRSSNRSLSCSVRRLASCSGHFPINRYRTKSNRAFTLLELLVVLAIIASLLSLTVVMYRTDDNRELQLETAQELRLFLQHKIDQTWLDGVTYGLQITAQKVSFFELNLEDGSWQESNYSWQPKHEEIQVRLLSSEDLLSGNSSGDNEKSDIDTPSENPVAIDDVNDSTGHDADEEDMDIVFMSSGEYSPFYLQIEMEGTETASYPFTLQGDGVNALQIVES